LNLRAKTTRAAHVIPAGAGIQAGDIIVQVVLALRRKDGSWLL